MTSILADEVRAGLIAGRKYYDEEGKKLESVEDVLHTLREVSVVYATAARADRSLLRTSVPSSGLSRATLGMAYP